MKTLMTIIIAACLAFTACSSGTTSEKDKEKQDSLAAKAAADSMMQAATADTLKPDQVLKDSTKK